MTFQDNLKKKMEEGVIPKKALSTLDQFYKSFQKAMQEDGLDSRQLDKSLALLLQFIEQEVKHPFPFPSFHKRVEEGFDYYQFGLDFIRPLVRFESSSVQGISNIEKMMGQLKNKENVILFANHQIEPDPHVICLMLEKNFPEFAKDIIFVAGDRVITDLLTIPFSMGMNLVCIHSKRHINFPPELKEKKLLHNQLAMRGLGEILASGGKCLYVAASGGRDRKDANGALKVSPFDPGSIEIFQLLAKKAKTKTHFYPLALSTYNLFPPPQKIETKIGEMRLVNRSAVHLAFGEEIDMEALDADDKTLDKHKKRENRAHAIWDLVQTLYQGIA